MKNRNFRCNYLLGRIQKGDEGALEKLYAEFGALFLSIAKKYLVNKDLAEDVLSEVFVEIVKTNVRTYDPSRNAFNWIFTIIKRKAFAQNAKTLLESHLNDEKVEREYLSFCITDGFEDAAILRAALSKRSEEENKLLYYKYWQGLTVREIAKLLDKPKSSVQYIIDGAIKELKKYLDNKDEI